MTEEMIDGIPYLDWLYEKYKNEPMRSMSKVIMRVRDIDAPLGTGTSIKFTEDANTRSIDRMVNYIASIMDNSGSDK